MHRIRNIDPCHRQAYDRDNGARGRALIVPKAVYDTAEDADLAAARLRQRPYQCPRCGKWHTTAKDAS